MKVIKNILIGLGVIFSLVIVLAIFVAGESGGFKEENEEYVMDFLRRFSQTWEVSGVSDEMTSELLVQIQTPNGHHAMNYFRTLGRLEDVRDLEIQSYRSGTGGETGVFVFKAKFQNADTVVVFTLRKIDGQRRVHGINIRPLENIEPGSAVTA